MLEYNVLLYEENDKELRSYNIFNNIWVSKFIEEVKRDKGKFDELKFKNILKNQFWLRFEFEFGAVHLIKTSKQDIIKVDAYTQIEPNFNVLCEYVRNHWMEK